MVMSSKLWIFEWSERGKIVVKIDAIAGRIGETSFRMLKLGELGETIFGMIY